MGITTRFKPAKITPTQRVLGALRGALLLPAMLCASLTHAADDPALIFVAELPFDIPYTEDGADDCLRCHDETSEFPVMAIFKTDHANLADPNTPFAKQQCESCHGPGSEHAGRVRRGNPRPAILGFEKHSSGTLEQRNGVCLDCHQDSHDFRTWQNSAHANEELACTDCHKVHTHSDPVKTREQANVCFGCHAEQRADSMKFSSHPLQDGQLLCSDCHTPHSSLQMASITHFSTNELCFSCHEEKRGPFLWEHAPVTEDCSSCHEAHGSNHPALLTRRSPLLCQQCHSNRDHPSLALGADNVLGDTPRAEVFMLGSGCVNCHSQVHGSNHPSGAGLNR